MDRQHEQLEKLRPAESGITTLEGLVNSYGVEGLPVGPLSGLKKDAMKYAQDLGIE